MGYPLQLALRYLGSKKRGFISVSTAFAILGVALGVAALATVMAVTGGFQAQFREKILGVNAHVLVQKYSTDFREYRDVMAKVAQIPGVVGIEPFTMSPMMVSHADRTASGVLLKGVDPERMPEVLDLPSHVKEGSLEGLRRPGALPPPRSSDMPNALAPLSVPDLDELPKGLPVDGGATDAGSMGDERDDAGRNVGLLRAIEATLGDAGARPAAPAAEDEGDAGSVAVATKDESEDEDPLRNLPASAPRGSIVPEGGYKTVLPDDDELPADVAPDPCADPKLVAEMPGLVIGRTLAKNLAVSVGDCVEVTSPTIGYSFSQGALKPPVAKQFRVIAIFEAGFDQYDSRLVYSDLYEAQGFYDQGDTVTGIEMKVADIDQARHISLQIADLLQNALYHTMDWEELNHGLFTALRIQQIGMSVVLGLVILVAAFTVIATLIMVVLDKQKEIAVLKAMGATDDAILRAFVWQGAIIGVIGTAFGLALGFVLCKGLLAWAFPLDPKVYFISHLPVQVRPQEFFVTGVIAIAICLAATVVPALYAARLPPADGLRAQ